jgi:ribosome-associated protein
LPTKVKKIENPLVNQILKSLDDRKAQDVICINLKGNEDAFVDYMIVCHGDSTTQVNAIAGNVEKDVNDILKIKPHHSPWSSAQSSSLAIMASMGSSDETPVGVPIFFGR